MMYNNKFVTCIKSNNKILREFKDVVKLPFGTEFTILLKNLNSVRAQVSVYIDGTDVSEDNYLIVEPNSEFELTRFIKNGNLTEGNRFKFIERTDKIEKHRGIKADDGLVRVEFQFEKPKAAVISTPRRSTIDDKLDDIKRELEKKADKTDGYRYYPPIYVQPYYPRTLGGQYPGDVWCGGNTTGGVTSTLSTTDSSPTPMNVNTSGAVSTSSLYSAPIGNAAQATLRSMSVNDAGITVPGSISNQEFSVVSSFPVEAETHVIVLKLVGDTDTGVQYKAPVTVKTKVECKFCGRMNKAASNFCSECGAALSPV